MGVEQADDRTLSPVDDGQGGGIEGQYLGAAAWSACFQPLVKSLTGLLANRPSHEGAAEAI